ncbi:MAG: hypothetical protein IAE83_13940 [Anaerolinea sp.]|nr:hypothetical protein [Anaerolinea sp.]
MRKRKTDLYQDEATTPNFWERAGGLALIGGMIGLLVIAGFATASWLSGRANPTPAPTVVVPVTNRINVPLVPTTNARTEGEAIFQAPLPASIAAMGAEDTTLWLITQPATQSRFEPDYPYVAGDQVSVSPDGTRLAFVDWHDPKTLIIQATDQASAQSNSELNLHSWAFDNPILFWAWDAEGKAFEVVTTNGAEAVFLYRAEIASMTAHHQLILSGISAPPVSDPATNRVLIVQPNPDNSAETILFTISSKCLYHSACLKSAQEIVRVPFQVHWADYHPSATGLILASVNGELYALNLGNKSLSRYDLPQGAFRPMISPDGRYVGYIEGDRSLMLIDLKTDGVYQMFAQDFAVTSFDWLP